MDWESEDPVTLKSYFHMGIISLNNSRRNGQGIRGSCDIEIIFLILGIISLNNSRCSGQGIRGSCDTEIIFFTWGIISLRIVYYLNLISNCKCHILVH